MCTCLNLKTKDHYFGRNLDLEYRFDEKVVITPRNYEFVLKNGNKIYTKYAMIGMANVNDNYPLYAEASNEEGLSIAGLYFPKNAYYFNPKEDKLSLTPYELIPYFLGLFGSIKEMKESLKKLIITNIPYQNLPLASLHFMISDQEECLVLEQTKDGLKIYENPVGVLTNNPPFDYQMTNLINYRNLSSHYELSRFSDKINLEQYCNGMGAIGLPGDNSSSSRFVRATFNKLNLITKDDEESSVTNFFHILDSVSMISGTTLTKEGKSDITIYSSCINTDKGIYYYKTYTNSQITAIKMNDENKNSSNLTIFNLIEKNQINYLN